MHNKSDSLLFIHWIGHREVTQIEWQTRIAIGAI